MLNVLPATAIPALDHSQIRPPVVPRRRGAQPFNSNALKHGLYAVRTPAPITGLSFSTGDSWQSAYESFNAIALGIQGLREEVLLVLNTIGRDRDFHSAMTSLRLKTKLVTNEMHMKVDSIKLREPIYDLQFASRHANDLIRWDFRSQGITRNAYSFRENRKLSDFYSHSFRKNERSSQMDSTFPFISAGQWAIVEPLIPPSNQVRRSGRPSADPWMLLDAIFWKFAHHARWQDLPSVYPPMLTCRRYYRRLFLSGCFAAIISALDQDLRFHHKVDLTSLVERGCFTITGKKVVLFSEFYGICHMRTALFFLQRGYQVLRLFRKKIHISLLLRELVK
jgi:transposase